MASRKTSIAHLFATCRLINQVDKQSMETQEKMITAVDTSILLDVFHPNSRNILLKSRKIHIQFTIYFCIL